MSDETVRAALYVLGTTGGLAVICIGVLIAVLQSPDVAALAVLASIASAAVGGVAGMITTRQQGQPPALSERPPSERPPPDRPERTPGAER
jgi:hypothetical protein